MHSCFFCECECECEGEGACTYLHSPKISVRLRVGTPPPRMASRVSAPVLMLMLSLRCRGGCAGRTEEAEVEGREYREMILSRKKIGGRCQKKKKNFWGGARASSARARAHHDDPLAGGDKAASLDGWQQLARRLKHFVNLGVGQALDVDERLLGHREEALDGGEASVFDFLLLEREKRDRHEESMQLFFSTRGVGEARKGPGGERVRK